MKIKITTDDIKYAEKILLPKRKAFDTERRDFIKNLDTVDLQAVPGSGKTTTLLAKLLILERHMPLDDGSGVLVISHTNAAVDEIKNKIGNYCPKLFTYPNFIGTIQSFVDQFLAIPFYVNKYKKKPYRIDNEIYDERIEKYYKKFIKNKSTWIDKRSDPVDFLKKIRYHGDWNLIQSLGKNPNDFSPTKTTDTSKRFIIPMKNNMMRFGYLHFDDAYFLANLYIQKFSKIKRLLRKRFQFVFVDEMQDIEKHQHDILEKLFFTGKLSKYCYQRIGDKNQAIYGGEIKLDNIWNEDDRKKLHLNGSHRLTPEIAAVVKYFGLNYQEVKGLRESCNIKPHIIVFENPANVLPKFVSIIKDKEIKDGKHPFCAIGWTGDYKYKDRGKTNPDKSKLTIKCYHENFEKKHHKIKIDYSCLKDYLKYYDKKDGSLASVRKNILNIFIKILRIENKKDENDRNYTIRKFMNFLRENQEEKYKEIKLKLFEWSFSIKKRMEVYDDLKNYIQSFFKEIFPEISLSQEANSFINTDELLEIENTNVPIRLENPNIFEYQNIKIKVGTVHSVKGKTHAATLFMETYYKGRSGKNGYESERLKSQVEGSRFSDTRANHKKSTKLVYVGFSRPTHLLCFAIHKDRMNDDFNNNNWEVVHIA